MSAADLTDLQPDDEAALADARFQALQYGISFQSSLFVQTGLPVRDPKALVWIRRNGFHELSLTTSAVQVAPDGTSKPLGLPFGSIPRMMFAHLTTEALRTGNPKVDLGKSVVELARDLLGWKKATGGKNGNVTRFRNQVQRMLNMQIAAKWTGTAGRETGQMFLLASGYNLWYTDQDRSEGEKAESSYIQLSHEFFQRARRHAVPLSIPALVELRNSPLQIDLYSFLTWRYARMKEPNPVFIPYSAFMEAFGGNYSDTRQGRSEFRQTIREHIVAVRKVYPEADVVEDSNQTGLWLNPSPPHVPFRALQTLSRAEVPAAS